MQIRARVEKTIRDVAYQYLLRLVILISFTLPRVGGQLVSHRVYAELLEEIQTGIYSTCVQLPSENELAFQYKVSRSIIRDALNILERKGLLKRMRGIGTIIHREIVNLHTRIDLKLEYNALIRGMGYTPRVDSLTLRHEEADEKLAAQLGIAPGAAMFVCEKRLLAGDTPVIYSIDRIPMAFLLEINYADVDWTMPIFDLLESHLGITVDTDISMLRAILGPRDIREKLELPDNDALLFIDGVHSGR